MTNNLVPPSKALGYSDIYLDFVSGREPSAHFYLSTSLSETAAQLDRKGYERLRLSAILRAQNTAYQSSEAAFAAIDRLERPDSVCVFAGQQAGLFGGPMYTIIKAIAIVKAARLYERQLGRPVIPVFWIAGDDHDFAEVNHFTVLDRAGEPATISYSANPPEEVSTADIRFSDSMELERCHADLRKALGDTDFTPEMYALLEHAYTDRDTFCSAFGKLMASLTKDMGLVLFCPGDAAVKQLAVPFFKQIVMLQDHIHDLLVRTNHEIVESGYHIQVEKKDNSAHLFYNLDGRRPVLRDGDGFVVGEHRFSRTELLGAIDSHPERFSPDVITRPVLQSYLFPTISQKGGPAEIAYLAQINPIFSVFDLPVPVQRARATVTVIESRFEKLMKDYDVTFEDVTGDIELVVNRVLQRSFPQDLEHSFEYLRNDVSRRFREFLQESLEFDPNLQQVGEQAHGKIDYTLKSFEEKVFSSHKKKSKETRDRIYRLWHALYPNRGFQERTLNVTYFLARYGFHFIRVLHDHMDSEETAHQLMYLSEAEL
ncbi:MAG: bacillithiol biosynthesis cysteine-adding enzyme BshC [candidate division Zixibacteria bacterium]|nr:bacillithiol biosynthesis cysteine-adding enzyme BshC [candidate division Zixibacteria bacterium]